MATDPMTPSDADPAATYTAPPSSVAPSRSSEIKLISHSSLFYWWPVWALSFLMALVTLIENNRLAVVPTGTRVTQSADDPSKYEMTVPEKRATSSLRNALDLTKYNAEEKLDGAVFKPRISGESWPGGIFLVGLVLTIFITNVPLRGLWSFLVIISIIVVALLLALLNLWDDIFSMLGDLHIHINMAGYLTIGLLLFIIWASATFFFDRRTFVLFTPGQVRVCEHIGDAVQTFPSNSVSVEKQRDDLFRHYIYGLGSGDLIVKVGGGADRKEFRMPNVLLLGPRLEKVQDMLRMLPTT